MGYRLKVDNLHRELGLFTGLIFFTKTDTDILETRYLFSLSIFFKNATFGGGNDPVCPNCNCLCGLSTLRFSGGPATGGQHCLLCSRTARFARYADERNVGCVYHRSSSIKNQTIYIGSVKAITGAFFLEGVLYIKLISHVPISVSTRMTLA